MKPDPDGRVRPKLLKRSESETREFFFSHFQVVGCRYESPCWKWTGGCDAYGYGVIKFDGKNVKSHRYSAILHFGEPNDRKALACHKCDNPSCVNPDHIYWGTHKHNSDDMISRGRAVHAKGEDASNTKLKTEDVVEIKRLRSLKVSFRQIGRMFGIGKSTVQAIVYGQTWRHLT